MSAFTSVQSGDWNDGATWGNSSPGTKGVDWPGNASDTFTVAAGHTVTYNVSEANALGASTINGILTFLASVNTQLSFGNVTLTVSATGELRVGTLTTPIESTVSAILSWATTADNTQGLSITAGGKLTVYGNAGYYGADLDTVLASDAENTDGDAVIVTADDMSSKWHAGDDILIRVTRVAPFFPTAEKSAAVRRTINSISGTQITLTASVTVDANVGSAWTGYIYNLTRNIQFVKASADTVVGDGSNHFNTLRPRVVDNNTTAGNVTIKDASFTGFYVVSFKNGATFENCVFRNGNMGINGVSPYTNATFTKCIFAHCSDGINYAFFASITDCIFAACVAGIRVAAHCSIIRAVLFANSTAVSGMSGKGSLMTDSNIECNSTGIDQNFDGRISGTRFASNYLSAQKNDLQFYNCDWGYDSNSLSNPNTNDFNVHLPYAKSVSHLYYCGLPASGAYTILNRNQIGQQFVLLCDHYNRSNGAHRIVDCFGDVIKTACDGSGDAPSVDPDGGNGNVLAAVPQSNCSVGNFLPYWLNGNFKIYAVAGASKTYTFKVQATFAALSAGFLELLAEYLNSAVNPTLTTTSHSPAIATRTSAADWSQTLYVTINPAMSGLINFQILLKKYENAKVFVYPKVAIS
jgi:hypothetical protein